MRGALFEDGGFLLAAGLLVALAVWLFTLLRTKRPDPKMALLLKLLENLPKDEQEPCSESESAKPSRHNEVTHAGPRSFDFFA